MGAGLGILWLRKSGASGLERVLDGPCGAGLTGGCLKPLGAALQGAPVQPGGGVLGCKGAYEAENPGAEERAGVVVYASADAVLTVIGNPRSADLRPAVGQQGACSSRIYFD